MEEAMPADTVTERRPDLSDETTNRNTSDYIVIVFNNDTNTVEQVIEILRKATDCSQEEAEMETWEIHHTGRSIVHHGEQAECERAAAIIQTIGIKVAVEPV
jgi:ATP-dependent Clp protease adapter protein ClpS